MTDRANYSARQFGFLETSIGHLEYSWHGPGPEEAPTLVFLHEGLGSRGLWRDVPAELSARTGCGALVYSRGGYGQSDPVLLPRPIHYMHDEARILDEVLRAACIQCSILIGHSDGASIAIIHAGTSSARKLGLVLEAPHVFTEQYGLACIERVRDDYEGTDLRCRLEKHHGRNVDIAFHGWNQVWLHPDFRTWNIEEYLPLINVPVLVVQGDRDEHGTWAQVEAIQDQIPGNVDVLRVLDCAHSPHKERPEAVLPAIAQFIKRITK